MVSFGGNAGMEGLTHDMVVDGSIHDSVGILAVLWHFRSLGRACMNPWRGVFFFFTESAVSLMKKENIVRGK